MQWNCNRKHCHFWKKEAKMTTIKIILFLDGGTGNLWHSTCTSKLKLHVLKELKCRGQTPHDSEHLYALTKINGRWRQYCPSKECWSSCRTEPSEMKHDPKWPRNTEEREGREFLSTWIWIIAPHYCSLLSSFPWKWTAPYHVQSLKGLVWWWSGKRLWVSYFPENFQAEKTACVPEHV